VKKNVRLVLSPRDSHEERFYQPILAKKLDVDVQEISQIRVVRKSIDSRQKDIKVYMEFDVYIGEIPEKDPANSFHFREVSKRPEVFIVGAGPAGLFAALRLIELGLKPVILERGKPVDERKRDIARINREQIVDLNSNYCFGEGGAGTFSDGKLYTRSHKRGDVSRVIDLLHFFGASEKIRYEAHPHIGTDHLPRIVQNIREAIISAGGNVLFNTRMTGLTASGGLLQEVIDQRGTRYHAKHFILATGHSARDIYRLLHENQILLEAKAFAMGVRVEHPQELIDSAQYHRKNRGDYLPAAYYQLACQAEGRGVYSFCMCPGGHIVPSSTGLREIVVNGMSNSRRNSPYANSGIVTEIRLEDVAAFSQAGPLAGLIFQEQLERAAYAATGRGQVAPAQRLTDFLDKKFSASLPENSYIPGVLSSEMHEWMPEIISRSLQAGFRIFGRKMKGFVSDQALIVGVESRTSSPVRIPRDPLELHHPQLVNLYPAAEGAGYAGGIVSSALDGIRCAEAIARKNN
jgi:uncharacterized protein